MRQNASSCKTGPVSFSRPWRNRHRDMATHVGPVCIRKMGRQHSVDDEAASEPVGSGLTVAVESLADLRSDIAEEECLAHGLLALLGVGGGYHVPAVCSRMARVRSVSRPSRIDGVKIVTDHSPSGSSPAAWPGTLQQATGPGQPRRPSPPRHRPLRTH